MARTSIPLFRDDLFSEEGILDPYPRYAAIRRLGPVVWLEASQCYAVGRYADVKFVLETPDVFISGEGVAMNDELNSIRGSILMSDEPEHGRLRKLEIEPLAPSAIAKLRHRLFASADEQVAATLRHDGWFDGVEALATHLPLSVVMELGGLPDVARAKMLDWAAAVFDLQGPPNERATAAMPRLHEMVEFVHSAIDPSTVPQGSWTSRILELRDAGTIDNPMVASMLMDFIGPSLDTTIAGTASLFRILGENAEQWQRLQREPALIPTAINEALRLETPIRSFTRLSIADTMIGGIQIPAKARIVVLFASANRDEARWELPDRFDVTRRDASAQLAFGLGRHQCIGSNLARMEMAAITTALLKYAESIEVGEPVYAVNNILRLIKKLPMRMHAKSLAN